MKEDLDRLMVENEIHALLIVGGAFQNPNMNYFCGGAAIGRADVIKVRGKEPVIFHQIIERENAASTGMKTIPYTRYPEKELYQQANDDFYVFQALRYKHMLMDLGLPAGRVAIYGKTDINKIIPVINELDRKDSEYEIITGMEKDILDMARATKDASEIDRIKTVGEKTAEVVNLTADFLSNQHVKDNLLVNSAEVPITIGDMKKIINNWLIERNLENSGGVLFALGRDAGVPHNKGEDKQPLQIGVPIVFDISPCEAKGGYYYDMTRTWCLGYAPDDILEIFNHVLSVYETVVSRLKINDPFANSQVLACDCFENLGYPTIRQKPDLEQGYIHGIGHGVGLNIHEKPFATLLSSGMDNLEPGMVFTIEPGLYYPDKDFGVRIEDTFWVDDEGCFKVMAECPKELIIPVKK